MLNLRFAKDYLLHRLKAKSRHGIHSPFVYRLVDKVIYDFETKKVYAGVERVRKQLLDDERLITVTDLGAGSLVNNNRQKKIRDIAKNALKPPKLAQLLYRLAAEQQPQNIVELGTCLGITTIYLQKAAPKAKVYTLEGSPETAAIAFETFMDAGLNAKVEFKGKLDETIAIEMSSGESLNSMVEIVGNFDDTLPGLIEALDQLDFVFVDGNHQKDATLKYFEWCLPKVHENSLLIFDDIYWSEGMKEAWNEIKAHPKVTVTIDLFWIGLVFFKPGQVKENFLVRV